MSDASAAYPAMPTALGPGPVGSQGPSGPAGSGAPPGTPPPGASSWSRWLPMITAMAVAVTPIGVATITSQVAMSTTNKDYVGLAISVLNSEKSTPAMRNWATKVLERLAPVPMESGTRRDFMSGGTTLSATPQNCDAAKLNAPAAPPAGLTLPPGAAMRRDAQ